MTEINRQVQSSQPFKLFNLLKRQSDRVQLASIDNSVTCADKRHYLLNTHNRPQFDPGGNMIEKLNSLVLIRTSI